MEERHALWKQEVGTHLFILDQIKSNQSKFTADFHVAPRSPYSPETAYALRSTTPKNPYVSGSITPRSVGGLRRVWAPGSDASKSVGGLGSTMELWSCLQLY
jgi:hypothetical protein